MAQTADECLEQLPVTLLEKREADVAAMYERMAEADAERRARFTLHTLGCDNTQCRVVEYLPHSTKAQDQKCPACYGRPA